MESAPDQAGIGRRGAGLRPVLTVVTLTSNLTCKIWAIIIPI